MDAKTIDEMTYAEFDRAFSLEPVGEQKFFPFYHGSNETIFSDTACEIEAELRGEPVYMIGVIGGVDMPFNYITHLQPEKAFLFDLQEDAVKYLGLRLCLLETTEVLGDYYMDMMCANDYTRTALWHTPERRRCVELIRDAEIDLSSLTLQGIKFLKALGYKAESGAVEKVFFQPEFRRNAAMEYFKHLFCITDTEDIPNHWFAPDNLPKMKEIAAQGRVRGFRADLYNGFSQTAKKLVQAYDMKNVVLYLSNVPKASVSGRKGDDFIELERQVLARINTMCIDLAEDLDRLWVVDSHNYRNRILGRKIPD